MQPPILPSLLPLPSPHLLLPAAASPAPASPPRFVSQLLALQSERAEHVVWVQALFGELATRTRVGDWADSERHDGGPIDDGPIFVSRWFAHGTYSELSLAKYAQRHFAIRTNYFDPNAATRSRRVGALQPFQFCREMDALRAARSPLTPRCFWSTGDYALHYALPYYTCDLWKLMVEVVATPEAMVHLAMDIADALFARLAILHDANWAHLDIKPSNVLVGREGRIELADYGFAQPTHHRAVPLSFAGTWSYQPPEMLQCESIESPSHKADAFSMGLLLLDVVLQSSARLGSAADQSAAAWLGQQQLGLFEMAQWTRSGRPTPTGFGPHAWPTLFGEVQRRASTEVAGFIFDGLLCANPAERLTDRDAIIEAHHASSAAYLRNHQGFTRPITVQDGLAMVAGVKQTKLAALQAVRFHGDDRRSRAWAALADLGNTPERAHRAATRRPTSSSLAKQVLAA